MYIIIAIVIVLLLVAYKPKELFGFCFNMYTPSKSIKSLLIQNPKSIKGVQDKKCMLESMFINNNVMYLPNDSPNVCAGKNRV
jgi:hypothetical protein